MHLLVLWLRAVSRTIRRFKTKPEGKGWKPSCSWNRGDASWENLESLEPWANYVDQRSRKRKGSAASNSSTDRPVETPIQRRSRYLRAARSAVSDPDLWDFLHGATVDAESTYEEEVESEQGSEWFLAGDGSGCGRATWSQPTWKRRRRHVRRCQESLFLESAAKGAANSW